MGSRLIHRRQPVTHRGVRGVPGNRQSLDLIGGGGGHRGHRPRGIPQSRDGGFVSPEHVSILREHLFDHQWKTLWIQGKSGIQPHEKE
jgi:hypothetical protein